MSDGIEKLNREFIGKEYQTGPQLVDPDSIRQFSLATNEKNPRYLNTESGADIVPPPIYPVVFLPPILSQLVEDMEEMNLNILRAVHAEHKMSWREALRSGDRIHTIAKITNMEQRGINQVLEMQIRCMREDVIVVEMIYRLIIRGKKTKGKEKPAGVIQAPEKRDVLVKGTSVVTDDQGVRYAEASGDHNPIHTSDEIARSVGLPRAILHGLCTMALASQVLVDELLDGDSNRLKSMEVRFSKPVLLDQSIVTKVYDAGIKDSGIHVVHFETRDEKDIPVLVHGMAEFIE